MFIGLGRTNNYIENFVMGIPKAFRDVRFLLLEMTFIRMYKQLNGRLLFLILSSSLTQMLTNSKFYNFSLYISKNSWTLDVFVNPTSGTLYVVLATIAILLVLGVIILYLHRKEKVINTLFILFSYR